MYSGEYKSLTNAEIQEILEGKDTYTQTNKIAAIEMVWEHK